MAKKLVDEEAQFPMIFGTDRQALEHLSSKGALGREDTSNTTADEIDDFARMYIETNDKGILIQGLPGPQVNIFANLDLTGAIYYLGLGAVINGYLGLKKAQGSKLGKAHKIIEDMEKESKTYMAERINGMKAMQDIKNGSMDYLVKMNTMPIYSAMYAKIEDSINAIPAASVRKLKKPTETVAHWKTRTIDYNGAALASVYASV